MGNVIAKLEVVDNNYPVELGAFITEQRAPRPSEVQLFKNAIDVAVKNGDLDPVDNNYTHKVQNGYYWRALFLPKNSFAVGKVHRKAHIFFVTEGAVSIYSTVDGVKHMRAGDTFLMSSMSQKIAIASEDSWVLTCDPTTKYTPEEAELELLQ